MTATTQTEQVMALVREHGILRPRDLEEHGLPRECLIRLHREGLLRRPSRGLYVATDAEPSEHRILAEASKRVPHGNICLLSALWFHGLLPEAPENVWMAIEVKARRPRTRTLPLKIVRFSGTALTLGLEEHLVENVPVRVYSMAKTVADCFKYRGKIGLDLAVEMLNMAWSSDKVSMWDLTNAAKACRVTKTMEEHLNRLV